LQVVRGWRLSTDTVQLAAALGKQMLAEAEQYAPCETGGVLLGESDREAARVVVTELIGAGPGARRERHRFVPDGAWQRNRIAERYEIAGRTLEYLGDWHSHPYGNGPSRLDRATARKIATTPAARCRYPVFVIATRVGAEWELRAYRFARRRFRHVLLITGLGAGGDLFSGQNAS
jgi:integrative and conjugative element protein (TIGR02256 family)